jgi:hypothetical protein
VAVVLAINYAPEIEYWELLISKREMAWNLPYLVRKYAILYLSTRENQNKYKKPLKQ